ncbi:MAG: glycosyltransferase family 4 protein, partial [Isosphaeraceae bacterium]
TDADDDAIRRLYWKSWANVLSSVYQDCYGVIYREPELMGFTLLEAMACGTPAIASRVAAMPEFIQEGHTGYVYDTPEQLTEQLRLLSKNPGLVERIGRNAREAVERDFDLKVAGARFLAVYEELIASAEEMAA